MYLSYQIGQGYWGDGGVCPQRGGFDLPKNPVATVVPGRYTDVTVVYVV